MERQGWRAGCMPVRTQRHCNITVRHIRHSISVHMKFFTDVRRTILTYSGIIRYCDALHPSCRYLGRATSNSSVFTPLLREVLHQWCGTICTPPFARHPLRTLIQYRHSSTLPKVAMSRQIVPRLLPRSSRLLSPRCYLPVNIASILMVGEPP